MQISIELHFTFAQSNKRLKLNWPIVPIRNAPLNFCHTRTPKCMQSLCISTRKHLSLIAWPAQHTYGWEDIEHTQIAHLWLLFNTLLLHFIMLCDVKTKTYSLSGSLLLSHIVKQIVSKYTFSFTSTQTHANMPYLPLFLGDGLKFNENVSNESIFGKSIHFFFYWITAIFGKEKFVKSWEFISFNLDFHFLVAHTTHKQLQIMLNFKIINSAQHFSLTYSLNIKKITNFHFSYIRK